MSPLAEVVQSLGPNQRVAYQSAGDWLLATVTDRTDPRAPHEHWLAHVDGSPRLLQGYPELSVALSAVGDVVGSQLQPSERGVVLTVWGPDGVIKHDRPFSVGRDGPRHLHVDVSTNGDRIVVFPPFTDPRKARVSLLDSELTTLWSVPTDALRPSQFALAPDASSVVVVSGRSAVRLSGETGALQAEVRHTSDRSKRLDHIVGWIDGEWVLTRRPFPRGEVVPVAQWLNDGSLAYCSSMAPVPQLFHQGQQSWWTYANGMRRPWAPCGSPDAPLALPEPRAETNGSTWLREFLYLGGQPWAAVSGQSDLLPLRNDFTWEGNPQIRRRCDTLLASHRTPVLACTGNDIVDGRRQLWAQFHSPHTGHTDITTWGTPEGHDEQVPILIPGLPGVLFTPVQRGESYILSGAEPDLILLPSTLRVDVNDRGDIETLVDGRLSAWRFGAFVPTVSWRACHGNVSQWMRDDGVVTVVCASGTVQQFPIGRPSPPTVELGSWQHTRLVDAPGLGNYYAFSNGIPFPQVISDGVVRPGTALDLMDAIEASRSASDVAIRTPAGWTDLAD